MRAVVLTRHGPPDVLEVQERPPPGRPLGGEVLIDVDAAGVDFADTMARAGLSADAPEPPCVVGYEVAGTVTDVGPGVEELEPGQRVMAATRFGGYAEQIKVPASDVVPIPERVSSPRAAAVPVNYATAWAALMEYGGLRRNHRVLVHVAAGGVGIAAVQIARRFGAEVYGTASPFKHEAVLRLGVHHAIDYRRAGWQRDLPKFDLVLDAVGGRSFRVGYELLRPGGRLVCYTASAAMSGARRNLAAAARTAVSLPRFSLARQMRESKSVIGLNLMRLWDDRGTLRQWIDPLAELLADGTIDPIVAERVPFDRAPDAHRIVAERRDVGKVVLVP